MTGREMEIRLHRIHPNLRTVCQGDAIQTLYTSIRSQGLKHPIRISFDGERLRIVDGEKRWRACKRLGISRIKAILVE